MLSPWWLPKETPGVAFYNRELEGVIASLRELEDNTFFRMLLRFSRRTNYWPITPSNSL